MILQETFVKLKDNSGIFWGKCIKVLGGSKKKYANYGDMIKIAVNRKYRRFKKKLKNNIYFAIVVSLNKIMRRKNGIFLKFKKNGVISLSLDPRLKIYKLLGNKMKIKFLRELSHYSNKITKFSIFYRRNI